MPSIAQSWNATRSRRYTEAEEKRKAIDSDRPTVHSHGREHDAIAFVNDHGTVTTWQRTLDREDAMALACFLIAVYYGHEAPKPPPVVAP